MKNRPVFIYTEDAPVKKDVVARGMSRAGSPLLRSIGDHIDGIAIFHRHKWYEKQALDPELADRSHVVPRTTTILCKILRRIGLPETADRISARFSIRIARKSAASIVFAYIGTDAGMLIRTAHIARMSGKSYAFYIVDDFIASLKIRGTKETLVERTQKKAGEALLGAKHIFAISTGLGDHLSKAFGVTTTTLPLPFEPDTITFPALKLQIIYVGSINFLYRNGLLNLFSAVERIRDNSGLDISIRLTFSEPQAREELGELPPFVLAVPAPTAENLANEIASSLFAFLPYSFADREKAMVSTSFPSKLLEYLAYARSIVVYAPTYAVTTRLFLSAALPSVISSSDELEEAIRVHLEARPCYSPLYRRYLTLEHSLTAVGLALCKELCLETH